MTEAPAEPGDQPKQPTGELCPMCREQLKPDAKACVWCGFLLLDQMQREQAAQRRRKFLGRARQAEPKMDRVDHAACLAIALVLPVGLVAGEGGAVTWISVLLLLITAGLGFIALVRLQIRRFLIYSLAGAIGTGLFIILLIAYGVAR